MSSASQHPRSSRLSPPQFHPFSQKTYLCAYIIFLMALESSGDSYPDLTGWEFLEFYGMGRSSNDSFKVATFCRKDNGQALVNLESHYLNDKAWHSRFFVVFEYVFKDFSIKAIWDLIPTEKSLRVNMDPLLLWKKTCIAVVEE